MPSLLELQADFARGLRGEASALDAWVGAGDFTAAQRLGIYRNNYRISLRGALADVYPVVCQLVGDGFFAFAADHFLPRHPSRSGNLHDFGSEFPAFLANLPEAAELAYLPDVARLEWAWHAAFHAANSDTPDLAQLAQVPAEAHALVGFLTAPSLSLVESPWPVTRIWEAHQDDGGPGATIDLDAGGERVTVHRIDDEVIVARVPDADFAMLRAFDSGARLGAACEAAVEVDAKADVGAVLMRVCASGALGGLILPD